MDKQTRERRPEFQQFLQQVEAALIKSAAEARRKAAMDWAMKPEPVRHVGEHK